MPVHGYFIGNNYYGLVFGIVVIGLLDFTFWRNRRNPAPEDTSASASRIPGTRPRRSPTLS